MAVFGLLCVFLLSGISEATAQEGQSIPAQFVGLWRVDITGPPIHYEVRADGSCTWYVRGQAGSDKCRMRIAGRRWWLAVGGQEERTGTHFIDPQGILTLSTTMDRERWRRVDRLDLGAGDRNPVPLLPPIGSAPGIVRSASAEALTIEADRDLTGNVPRGTLLTFVPDRDSKVSGPAVWPTSLKPGASVTVDYRRAGNLLIAGKVWLRHAGPSFEVRRPLPPSGERKDDERPRDKTRPPTWTTSYEIAAVNGFFNDQRLICVVASDQDARNLGLGSAAWQGLGKKAILVWLNPDAPSTAPSDAADWNRFDARGVMKMLQVTGRLPQVLLVEASKNNREPDNVLCRVGAETTAEDWPGRIEQCLTRQK